MDALLTDTTDEKLLNLAGQNRGLLHFAEKQYTKAFNEFTAVLSRSPHDMVSANNKVRCSDTVRCQNLSLSIINATQTLNFSMLLHLLGSSMSSVTVGNVDRELLILQY